MRGGTNKKLEKNKPLPRARTPLRARTRAVTHARKHATARALAKKVKFYIMRFRAWWLLRHDKQQNKQNRQPRTN